MLVCHFLALGPQASNWSSLSLSFLICRIGIVWLEDSLRVSHLVVGTAMGTFIHSLQLGVCVCVSIPTGLDTWSF